MTARAAVLGSPIHHSLSPALHTAAYRGLGLDASYEAIEVRNGELAGFLAGCDDDWLGVSLTMPLKEEAVAVAVEVGPLAATLNAANTLLPVPCGWRAENTDVIGIVRSIGSVDGDRVVIVGAGASARSAVAALADLGIARATVLARRAEAAAECVALGRALGVELTAGPLDEDAELADCALVVSTLPPHAADALDVDGWCGTLLDIAYDPWPSRLATSWLQHGGRVVSGHEMLLHQAAEQVRLMTGMAPDVAAMRHGMEAELARRG